MSINVLLMAFFIIKKGRKKSIWANFRNAPAEQQISLQTDVSDAFFLHWLFALWLLVQQFLS